MTNVNAGYRKVKKKAVMIMYSLITSQTSDIKADNNGLNERKI